jgi:hypothetical protein
MPIEPEPPSSNVRARQARADYPLYLGHHIRAKSQSGLEILLVYKELGTTVTHTDAKQLRREPPALWQPR